MLGLVLVELELVQGQLKYESKVVAKLRWKVAVLNEDWLKRYSESCLELLGQRLAGARVGSRVEVVERESVQGLKSSTTSAKLSLQ
jgi:hypothetical protein